jgi:hypothetical protein
MYVHCSDCHHEWECATNDYPDRTCEWCGSGSYVLEEEIPLEELNIKIDINDIILNLKKLNNPLADKVIKKIKKYPKK